MIRLFANMVAGHLLLASIMGLIVVLQSYFVVPIALAGSLAISLLEVFVAFLQAYIFTFLTILFMAGFLHHDDEHGHLTPEASKVRGTKSLLHGSVEH